VEYLENFKRTRKSDSLFLFNAELILANGDLYPHKGIIETMESEFESGTGAIAVRAKFKNPELMLKHGSTGKIRLFDTFNNALLIPQKSALEIQDKNYVYLLDENQTVILKSFVPISRIGDFYVVGKGLEEKNVIVYEGIQNLREGMLIKPRFVTKEEIMKENVLVY
jgi:membrane fusion protein (multidrug efflux system)